MACEDSRPGTRVDTFLPHCPAGEDRQRRSADSGSVPVPRRRPKRIRRSFLREISTPRAKRRGAVRFSGARFRSLARAKRRGASVSGSQMFQVARNRAKLGCCHDLPILEDQITIRQREVSGATGEPGARCVPGRVRRHSANSEPQRNKTRPVCCDLPNRGRPDPRSAKWSYRQNPAPVAVPGRARRRPANSESQRNRTRASEFKSPQNKSLPPSPRLGNGLAPPHHHHQRGPHDDDQHRFNR